MKTLLHLQDLVKSFDHQIVLNHVSFELQTGEIIGLIGPSGAGKSTISKLICGFFKESKGDIIFEGKSLDGKTIKERGEEIGVVLQNPNQMIVH